MEGSEAQILCMLTTTAIHRIRRLTFVASSLAKFSGPLNSIHSAATCDYDNPYLLN